MVGGHIGGVGTDRHRRGKVHLLPARGRLIDKDGCGQQRTITAPQVADVGARVEVALVEADTGDVTVYV